MKIARRFRVAIEDGPGEFPRYAFVVFAVCAVDPAACGWGGWILDGVFAGHRETDATATRDALLPGDYSQRCPRCGLTLFRTAFERRMDVTPGQAEASCDAPSSERIEYE